MPSQGPRNPNSVANVSHGPFRDWIDPQNAAAAGGGRAAAELIPFALQGMVTQYLIARDFGFSIPEGATITGVTVEVARHASTTLNEPRDNVVHLTDGASPDPLLGTTRAKADTWPLTDEYAVYGGENDLWDTHLPPWDVVLTPEVVNSPAFGVVFSAEAVQSKGTLTVFVDHVRVTIHYTPAE